MSTGGWRAVLRTSRDSDSQLLTGANSNWTRTSATDEEKPRREQPVAVRGNDEKPSREQPVAVRGNTCYGKSGREVTSEVAKMFAFGA